MEKKIFKADFKELNGDQVREFGSEMAIGLIIFNSSDESMDQLKETINKNAEFFCHTHFEINDEEIKWFQNNGNLLVQWKK